MSKRPQKLFVLGVGNSDCGDDGVGMAVVNRLKQLNRQELELETVTGETSETIAAMNGHSRVVIVDAIVSQNAVGTLHIFDASHLPLPLDIFGHFSTHSFGIVEAVELARALGELPEMTVVLAVEGERFEPGDSLSPKVASAVDDAAEWIINRSDTYSLVEH